MIGRLSACRGFTIAEVLISLMVLMSASTATMAAVGASKRTTAKAQRSAEATRLAQSTLDKLKNLEYVQLGLTADVTAADVPPGEGSRFLPDANNPTKLSVGNGSQFVDEELVQPSNGGALDDPDQPAGQVDPAPKAVTVSSYGAEQTGTSFLIYRYVTWHDEQCFGTGASDLCPVVDARGRSHDLKRAVVAVVPGKMDSGTAVRSTSAGATKTVWASTLIVDPKESSAKPPCVGNGCTGAADNYPLQELFMWDVPCATADVDNPGDPVAYPPASHPVHRTSVEAPGSWLDGRQTSACRNDTPETAGATNGCFDAGAPKCQPDLLSTFIPGEVCSSADPALCGADAGIRYATDLKMSDSQYGYGPYSRPVKEAPGCTYSSNPAETASMDNTNANDAMVQTWSTDELNADDFHDTNTEGFLVRGFMKLNMYVGFYGDPIIGRRGKACVTLIDRDEGTSGDPTANDKILYEFYCQTNRWQIGIGEYFRDPAHPETPLSDTRGGKLLRKRDQCQFNPIVGERNTFRDPSDPNYSKVQVFPVGGWRVPHGHRLVLRVAADSAGADGSLHPLVLYYGQLDMQSEIFLSTSDDSVLGPSL